MVVNRPLEHDPTVDDDGVDVRLLAGVHERRERLVHGHGLQPIGVEEEEVREPADLQRPEVGG